MGATDDRMPAEGLRKAVPHIMLDMRQMQAFSRSPLIIREARGIHLFDIEGRRYIDGISGIYVVNIGHGNGHVIEAIRRQQERASFVAPLHAVSDIALEYVARLVDITPGNLDVVKLLSGGSEATETAIKFARQYHRQTGSPGRYKVVANYRGYHGATLGALSASGLGGPRKSVFGPFLEGFVHVHPPTCFRCPYGLERPGCGTLCARQVGSAIESEGPESVAAFLLEPVGNTGGIVVPPPEYFAIVREACTRLGVLLVFDEIITGMGRTGSWFAAQTFGVAPDVLCAGKGLAGGYAPLAATAVREDLYRAGFWGEEEANIQFAHGHTFGGNPVAAAAGLATIEVVEREGLMENGRRTGAHLRARLERGIADAGVLGEVRGVGCLLGVEFVRDMATREPFPPERQFGKCVERRLLEQGLILRCDPSWIAVAPPLITTLEQADEIAGILVRCVKAEAECGS
jgi:adenosylmethionine-8-amino-7-oxononanoate aminotransferase